MKFYKTDWFLKLCSIVGAVILWAYVTHMGNPVYKKTITNIPIKQINVPSDFENGKLVMTDVSHNTASVTIRGNRNAVAKAMKRLEGNVIMDMKETGTPNDNHSVAVKVDFDIDGVEVIKTRPEAVKVAVDKVVTYEKSITVKTKNDTPEGFAPGVCAISPLTVKLTGPEKIVGTVAESSITVDLSGITEDIHGSYKIKFYDAEGDEITDPSITKNIEYTEVYYPILNTIKVPVEIKVNSKRNSSGTPVAATCVPKEIELKGRPEDLEGIDKVITESVNVMNIKETTEKEVDIIKPDGVSFAEGDNVKVTLTVGE